MTLNGLIDRLRCSPTLRQPNALDRDWFDSESRSSPVSVAHGGATKAGVRPRCASLSLILREAKGKVEMMVIKRATNPR